jgi:hypothetical protein
MSAWRPIPMCDSVCYSVSGAGIMAARVVLGIE